ncbi:MAG TPA: malto-oligosyltrehalose trehalohydrolase [Steroidobacteraceae bacterium]|nr:malto-oligosyltrehalose trehalohydrolase [Steroidobacteraceae bacterium]
MILCVWAPFARSVELVTPERRIGLSPQPQGYWRVEIDAAAVRGGYKYSLDGGKPLPDPRSRWQPEGVHGASHPIEPAGAAQRPAARFLPKALRDAVIYELHVGTFTPAGTYAGARERLAHLAGLGITHVELMPLATFPGRRGWGYDGVDLYAPLPAYGTPAELEAFIRACHEHGLAVLLDVVYNHLGPDGNYLGLYGPYFSDRVKTPWGEAVNYDGAQSDEVRRFVIDNACMWLRDYGFDGLRLDAVHAIFSFEAIHILEELARAVHALAAQLDRELVLIAESDLNDPRLVLGQARGGFGLDAHWADDFHHALHRYFTGESAGYYADFGGLRDVAAALSEGYVYQGQYSPFRQRRHGRPPRGVKPDQLVVCSQNHDQIGNRARGERLSMLLGPAQLKAIAALTLLSPFVPLLFQGEEWGARTPFLYFTDHQDPELGRAVSAGRAREFERFRWAGEVPDPQSPETFERCKLDWMELDSPLHADLLDWYRRLIAVRAARPGRGARARPKVRFDERAAWLRLEFEGVLALCNFADVARRITLPAGSWTLALRSDEAETTAATAQTAAAEAAAARLPAHATWVYRRG